MNVDTPPEVDRDVVVAACQFAWSPDHDDRPGVLLAAFDEALAAGAELIIAPELATTGSSLRTPAESIALAEPVDGPLISAARRWSQEHDRVVVFGWAERRGDDTLPYNSGVVIDRGAIAGVTRKVHLWGREKELFSPGEVLPSVIDTSVGRVAIAICYDLEIPEQTRAASLAGARLLLAPSNWPLLSPAAPDWRPIEIAKAQATAAVNQVFVVVADRCGTDRTEDWTGGSVIVDRTGDVLAGPSLGRPALLTASVRPAAAADKRIGAYNDAFGDLRPELYHLGRTGPA